MKKKLILTPLLIILIIILIILTLSYIKNIKKDSIKFKKEYESFNEKENNNFKYRNLSIDKNNPFIYSNAKEIIEKIESKETFIVYFGDPECPWCRSVIEQSVKSALDNNITKIYYVRMWNGFHNEKLRDVYELENNELILKQKGTDDYYKLLNYFDNVLDDYALIDDNGNTVRVNEKRIFALSFVFVREGKAEDLIQGISKKQNTFNSKLNKEIIQEEKQIFDNFYEKINSCFDKC